MTGYKPERVRRAELLDALAEVDLTERDRKIIDWLAGWDQDTTDVIADLIRRARLHQALTDRT
jgi:hypothetical protein